MNDKKNLDRLFQEKFKDFEAEPREQVWRNIESALKQKNKKKAIPLWYRVSGVAAAVIIGAAIFSTVFNDPVKMENEIVTKENQQIIDSQMDAERSGIATGKANPENLINDESTVSTDKTSLNNTENDIVNDTDNTHKNDAIVTSSNQNQQKSINKKPKSLIKQSESVASESLKKYKKGTKESNINNLENNVAEKTASVSRTEILENRKAAIEKNTLETGIAASGSKNGKISENADFPENASQNQNTSITNNQKNEQNNITNPTGIHNAARKAVIAEKTVGQKLDSTAIATVEPINALEELLKENEKEKKMIAETKVNRWQITSNVAPIYFGSASNGSPIDEQFSGNDKSYGNNLSFGVGLNYAVNKKINIRSGVNKLTLGYNTNNVIFYAGLGSKNFDNITPTGNATFIEVISDAVAAQMLPFENNLQNTKLGYITQTMGYIEVPMEMSYKIADNKFGVTLIGGLSTLFLNGNEVRITSNDLRASLGKANNLNELHFSSNIGMGFQYSFWKNFQFNFEPMFKYQINTFSKNDGDFKPYFFGLYSGISFKF